MFQGNFSQAKQSIKSRNEIDFEFRIFSTILKSVLLPILSDLFRLEQFFGVSFLVLKELRPSPIGKVLQKKKLVSKSTNELKCREIVLK